MKPLKKIAALLGLMTVSLSASAAFELGEVVRDYNVIVFGDYTAQYGDTQGRLAVGGDLWIQNYGIIEKLDNPVEDLSNNKLSTSLVVGGNATIDRTNIYYGDAVIAGNATVTNSSLSRNLWVNKDAVIKSGSLGAGGGVRTGGSLTATAFNYNGWHETATTPLPLDFSYQQDYLTNYSSALAGYSSTGAVSRSDYRGSDPYMLTLSGSGSGNMQVFNLTADDLANAYDISLLDIGDATSVLINVTGEYVSMMNMGGGDPDDVANLLNPNTLFQNYAGVEVLFNFIDAETVELEGIGIYGTLLATNAEVIATEGRLTGLMVAASYFSERNFQINVHNITPAPEPSEYLMMLLGLAMVGFFVRKRRH